MATRALRRSVARVRAAAASDAAGLRQALAALLVSSGGDLLAGLTLGAITGTLEALPGLLVLVPAAIGMRGNIFGALGSRLGTAIHTGTFRFSWRRDTMVGQNLWASVVLTLSISAALAVLAKTMASLFGVTDTISLLDFLVISIVGGVLSSVVVLAVTLGVAGLSVRRGWDMDNVAAPLVTASGDMVTLPSLFLATFLVGLGGVTAAIGTLSALVALTALVLAWRTDREVMRRVLHESVPVLLVAGTIDIVAGLTIEHRVESFLTYPALLVLVPPFLEDTGALGGILSARLASKLHLGVITPAVRPQRPARDDFAIIGLLAVPVFTLLALSADLVSALFGFASPGALQMIAITLIGGLLSTAVAVAVSYYGSALTYRLGLDPDNYGIPLLTSTMDLVGALSLVFAIIVLRVA
ncbi:magnesium transporter [Rhabdothermincola sp.]|uniref:magnesium transporter n=1 Tax=Rhabdothermincola sp. TaxID=2820405 RepID=UPI002FDF5E1C